MDPQALLAQLAQFEEVQKGVISELRESRKPIYGPARKTIERVSRSDGPRDESHPFKSMGEFFRCVREGGNTPQQHPKLQEYAKKYQAHYKAAPTGLNETLGSDGGVLIPPQFVNQLLMNVWDNNIMERTTLFPMTSNRLAIPAVDETSRANGQRYGGVEARWRGEAENPGTTKPKFAQVELVPEDLTVIVRATNDLMDDAGPALETFLTEVCSRELRFKTGDAVFNGDGVGKPLGFMNSPALVTHTRAGANAVSTDDIVEMYARRLGNSAGYAWFYNQEVEPQLFQLTIGTGGSTQPVFLPPGGLSAAPFATILGRPAFSTEFNAALGSQGDVTLVDLSQYLMGSRGGMQSAVSMHVFFLTSEQAFRFTMRLDGKPWQKKPITPFKGTNTLSAFVALN